MLRAESSALIALLGPTDRRWRGRESVDTLYNEARNSSGRAGQFVAAS